MCCACLAAPGLLPARIDLVTLPARSSSQVTIYRSVDLTLVRETRVLTFRRGINEIQFSWANTLIDPTSLAIRVRSGGPDFVVLDASYPADASDCIVWSIEAAREGRAEVEIRYFASGLSWTADYAAIADEEETTLRLEPAFTIQNASGEDLENAQTRLVVGEVNLVEAILELARQHAADKLNLEFLDARGERRLNQWAMDEMALFEGEAVGVNNFFFARGGGVGGGAGYALQSEMKEIIKKAVSEYYLYTIEGTEDLDTGWGKQLPNPAIDGIPFDLSYEWNPDKYGEQVVKFYKFKNDEEHELGDTPLPGGLYHVSSATADGSLRHQGSFEHEYAPIGEDVELLLGGDGLVMYEEREMTFRRARFEFNPNGDPTGWDEDSDLEIEIRNSHGRPVPFKVTRPMGSQDWEITRSSHEFKTVDRETVELEIEIPAGSKTVIAFSVTTRTGSRSRTN